MNRKITRFSIFAALAACAAAIATQANASTINSNIPVAGSFNATLGGSGSASLTGASGTFKQWIGIGKFGSHTNIGVSAAAQTVGLTIPTVNPGTMSASGNFDLDYDDLTPGTPQVVNQSSLDLNGATNVPFTINVSPMVINTSLGNFNLQLAVSGTITDIDFNSTGGDPVLGGNGGTYSLPGNFDITLNGTVTGTLVGVPIIGNIGLGTLFTLASQTLTFPTLLPGFATTTDLQGGLPPFPNDMLANFAAALPFAIPVPLNLPIAVNQSTTVPNGSSGFSNLVINGNIAATLNLSNIAYNVSGTVPNVLVPEPGSMTLAGLGIVGLVGLALRRRK